MKLNKDAQAHWGDSAHWPKGQFLWIQRLRGDLVQPGRTRSDWAVGKLV